jgi:hypothetical protein
MEEDEFELEVEYAFNENAMKSSSVEEAVADNDHVPSKQAFVSQPTLSTTTTTATDLLSSHNNEELREEDINMLPFHPSQHDDNEKNYLTTSETWATISNQPTVTNTGSSYELPVLPDELDMEAAAIEAASRRKALIHTTTSPSSNEFDEIDEFGSVLEDAIISTSLTVPSEVKPILAASVPALVSIQASNNESDGEFYSSTPKEVQSSSSILDDEFSVSSPQPLPSSQTLSSTSSLSSSVSSLPPINSFVISAPNVAVLDLDSLNSEAMSSIPTSMPLSQAPKLTASSSSFSNLSTSTSILQPSQNALLELQQQLMSENHSEDVAASSSARGIEHSSTSSKEGGTMSSAAPTKIVSLVRAGPLTSVGEEDEEENEDDDDDEESDNEDDKEENDIDNHQESVPEIVKGINEASDLNQMPDSVETTAAPSALSAEEAELEAEFDRATASAVAQLAAQAASAPPPEAAPKKRLPLAFSEAARHLLSEQKTKPFLSVIIPTAADPESTCLSRLLANKLSASLVSERDAVFCVAKAQYDPHDAIHEHLLMTLFSSLTNTEAILGRTSWQTIGFQRDNDFTTDLRGGGLLGPLQALALIEGRPWLAKAMYQVSQEPISGFPFMIQSISLTAKVLQALRIGSLNGLCNAAATAAAGTKTLYPVLSAVNDFHAALALAFTRKWRESGATITRMGHIMQEVIPPLCKRPEQAFAMLIEADKVKRISSSISSLASTATSFSKY